MSTRRSHPAANRLAMLMPNEPHFVLRANDKLAPEHVEAWAIEAELHGYPAEEVAEARNIVAAMRRWRKKKKRRAD